MKNIFVITLLFFGAFNFANTLPFQSASCSISCFDGGEGGDGGCGCGGD